MSSATHRPATTTMNTTFFPVLKMPPITFRNTWEINPPLGELRRRKRHNPLAALTLDLGLLLGELPPQVLAHHR